MIVTRDGWIKRQKSFADVPSIRVRDDDRVGWVYRSRARQTVTFFTDRGAAYTMRANDIPLTTGHGEPIGKHFAFEDREHVVGVVCHDPRCLPDVSSAPAPPAGPVQAMLGGELATLNGDGPTSGLPLPPYAIALTAAGKVLRFALSAHSGTSTRKGRSVVRLDPIGPGRQGDRRRDHRRDREPLPGHPVGPGPDLPGLRGQRRRRAAKGVTAVKLDSKDAVIGFALANRMREGLTVRTNRGATQIVRATKYPVTSRGGRGYSILQRGSLDAVLPEDAVPVPPVEEVGE